MEKNRKEKKQAVLGLDVSKHQGKPRKKVKSKSESKTSSKKSLESPRATISTSTEQTGKLSFGMSEIELEPPREEATISTSTEQTGKLSFGMSEIELEPPREEIPKSQISGKTSSWTLNPRNVRKQSLFYFKKDTDSDTYTYFPETKHQKIPSWGRKSDNIRFIPDDCVEVSRLQNQIYHDIQEIKNRQQMNLQFRQNNIRATASEVKPSTKPSELLTKMDAQRAFLDSAGHRYPVYLSPPPQRMELKKAPTIPFQQPSWIENQKQLVANKQKVDPNNKQLPYQKIKKQLMENTKKQLPFEENSQRPAPIGEIYLPNDAKVEGKTEEVITQGQPETSEKGETPDKNIRDFPFEVKDQFPPEFPPRDVLQDSFREEIAVSEDLVEQTESESEVVETRRPPVKRSPPVISDLDAARLDALLSMIVSESELDRPKIDQEVHKAEQPEEVQTGQLDVTPASVEYNEVGVGDYEVGDNETSGREYEAGGGDATNHAGDYGDDTHHAGENGAAFGENEVGAEDDTHHAGDYGEEIAPLSEEDDIQNIEYTNEKDEDFNERKTSDNLSPPPFPEF